MNKNSKIYIAGNTGLVGSAIVRKLRSEGYNNLVFTQYPEYDLRNQKQVNDFFAKEKPEYVFIAAAKVGGINANETYPAEFVYDNMMIEFNTIHAAYQNDVKKLLFLGSSCIYPKYADQPMSEDELLTGELEPTNEPYAIAKISGLKMCDYYRRQYRCDFISAMPTNLYGPNDNYNLETSHVLPALIRKIHLAKCLENNDFKAIRKDLKTRPFSVETKYDSNWSDNGIKELLNSFGIKVINSVSSVNSVVSLTLWGSGSPYREFLHVDDLTDALLFLMNNYSDYGHINVGTGKDITIKNLAEMIKGIVGFQGKIEWDTSKPDGTPRKMLDVSKLNDEGWRENISLEDGITKVYEKYLN
ncbi:GDP-L-fucose synthase [candidate division KSB1 bacterium]|nr:GDP-L-fucose synthase [candidate division KSB1 bacterium]